MKDIKIRPPTPVAPNIRNFTQKVEILKEINREKAIILLQRLI